ncbi:COX assembly mitochondrial protein homolog [Cimex lectularius]|uniref:COX assembly mitochondrial protein n=1 Tax=Cimex lectularius TaxID=79782 RepID=A0A8I6RT00_CIMLE|nr:COX assembly mitochondrial protein homolog [Cimex lectularius]
MVVEAFESVNSEIKRKHKDSLGPHGLGDPNDKTLRKVEMEVLIPKKMRDKARLEKCTSEVADFNKCCKEHGLLMVLNCRKENTKMKDCYTYWYQNPEFKQLCTEEYLQERAEYRMTGITKKSKPRGKVENS